MKSQQSSDSATKSLSFSMTTLISKSLTRAICRLQTLFSGSERKIVGRAQVNGVEDCPPYPRCVHRMVGVSLRAPQS